MSSGAGTQRSLSWSDGRGGSSQALGIEDSSGNIILSVDSNDGCDINAPTTIHVDSSSEVPLIITDTNNNVVHQVNQTGITQSVDGSITRTVFTLVSGMNDYAESMFNMYSTVPSSYAVATTRYFRSRLQLGVHNNWFNNTYYPGNNQFLAIQGGVKGNTSVSYTHLTLPTNREV